MRALVRRDTTERIITLDLSGTPDVDVAENWHRQTRLIRPNSVTIRLRDAEVYEVTAIGPITRKDGSPGDRYGSMSWRAGRREQRTLDGAPDWIHTLVRYALTGATNWDQPAD
jgi:hypothetical protein